MHLQRNAGKVSEVDKKGLVVKRARTRVLLIHKAGPRLNAQLCLQRRKFNLYLAGQKCLFICNVNYPPEPPG